MTTLGALSGVLTWTLLEYLIHRFLGHEPRLRPNPFASEHVAHHALGDGFAPTWKKLAAVGGLVGALAAPLARLGAPALAWLGGLVACYAAYEVLHRRAHTHAGVGPYGRWLRAHHFAHHYGDAGTNFGVTSPLWDVVFRTYRPVSAVRIPRRFAMRWLVDPATGEVRPEHAGRFSLVG